MLTYILIHFLIQNNLTMKVKISIRLAFVMSLMSLLFMSSISCKKNDTLANSPIVGSWLMYQGADDDNNNGKIEDSEWHVFTKADYDLFKSLGFTGEVVFNGDGTAKLIPTQGTADLFKWTTKADGTFTISEVNSSSSSVFTSSPGDSEILYIDSKGDLRNDVVREVSSAGIVTKVVSGIKFKRN
jgi:hypothetical protein